MKAPVPTPTQTLALRRMAAADGTIRRVPGGFWVSGAVTLDKDGAPAHVYPQPLNEVWCDVQTVRAMERRGWVERTNELADEWGDPRRLTEAGRSAIPPA